MGGGVLLESSLFGVGEGGIGGGGDSADTGGKAGGLWTLASTGLGGRLGIGARGGPSSCAPGGGGAGGFDLRKEAGIVSKL